MLGIPLYVASPRHSIHRLVQNNSFINLYGLTPSESVEVINNFEPDKEFIAAYRETQVKMAALFSNPRELWVERKRLVDQIVREFRHINN